METQDTTTIMIYSEDHKVLTELCKKGQNYRDKFHEMIQNETKK